MAFSRRFCLEICFHFREGFIFLSVLVVQFFVFQARDREVVRTPRNMTCRFLHQSHFADIQKSFFMEAEEASDKHLMD